MLLITTNQAAEEWKSETTPEVAATNHALSTTGMKSQPVEQVQAQQSKHLTRENYIGLLLIVLFFLGGCYWAYQQVSHLTAKRFEDPGGVTFLFIVILSQLFVQPLAIKSALVIAPIDRWITLLTQWTTKN